MKLFNDKEKGAEVLSEWGLNLFYQLNRIRMAIDRKGNRIMQESNIPVQIEQVPIIMVIFIRRQVSQQEIAELLNRDKSSVQRTMLSLQKKNLLKIEQDSIDKRRNNITLTEEGVKIGKQIKTIMKKTEKALLAHLSDEERVAAEKQLEIFADRIHG